VTTKLLRSGVQGISRTTQANVVEYLRRAILSGELPPGTRLVQADLATALQVSVTPIREALWELNSQGLVDFGAFRGAVVHVPTLTELKDIFEVRMALLPACTHRGVTQTTPQKLDQAAAILNQMEAEADQTRWMALNRDFHNCLYGTKPNQHLQSVLERLGDIATIYINLSFAHNTAERSVSEQEHRDILAAYRVGDADQAIALSLSHIHTTLAAARQVLDA
jgi:DNA-binding GntR family transcriptional regulator